MYQFPGTNFNDLNLDWMLAQIKTIMAEWAQEETDLETWKVNTKDFLDAYLAEHCSDEAVRAQVSDVLDDMVDDGTLLNLLTVPVTDAVTAWLAERLVGSEYAIDRTFTQENAAPDAMLTGVVTGAAEFSFTDAGYVRYAYSSQNPQPVPLTDGSPTITADPNSATQKYRYVLIDVSNQIGKLYTFYGMAGGSSSIGMFVIDASGNVLDRYTAVSNAWKCFKIPANAKWLYVLHNNATAANANAKNNMLYNGPYAAQWIKYIDERLTALEAPATLGVVLDPNRSMMTLTDAGDLQEDDQRESLSEIRTDARDPQEDTESETDATTAPEETQRTNQR